MVKLRRGSIDGRCRLLVKILLLRSNSYANAEGWGDLVHAFTDPLKNSPLDEIILLLHTATPGPIERQSKYIRPVFYDRLDEVPELLLSMNPSDLWTDPTPAHQRRPHTGTATGVLPDSNHGGQRQQKRIETPEERIAQGKEAGVAVHGGDHEEEIGETRVDSAKVTQDADRRDLERKQAGAAEKLQAAYRRHLKGRGVVREGIDATQAYHWRLLRKRSTKMEWPGDSQYYLLFRVPLGYILVCLDVIKAFVESEKKAAKKRMTTEDRGGLDEAVEALNQYRYDGAHHALYRRANQSSSKLLKMTIALQKKLSPSSKLHEAQSLSDLQHAVLEVKAVVESLDGIPGSIGTRNQIKERWDRGLKWIFEKQEAEACVRP